MVMTTGTTTRSVLVNKSPPRHDMVLVQSVGSNAKEYMSPQEAARHVTIWNREEGRKIAGNAAPLRRNLAAYLATHPECEEYHNQDQELKRSGGIDPRTGKKFALMNKHVPIWHRKEGRKVTGNAAPLRKNLEAYLKKHPQCEVYNHQDKFPERAEAARRRAAEAEAEAEAAATAKPQHEPMDMPRPGPISGFGNARIVFKDQQHHPDFHDAGDRVPATCDMNYSNYNKPVVAIVTSPSDGTPYGMPLSPIGDYPHHARNDYKGAKGMYGQVEAANAEPSWQDMSRSWSNTPAWQIMAKRSHSANNGASSNNHDNYQMSDHTPQSTTNDSCASMEFSSPRSMMRQRCDFPMGSSLSSSPGTTPLSSDVPMLGGSCVFGSTAANSMDCSPVEPSNDMSFSPSHFLVSGSFPGRI